MAKPLVRQTIADDQESVATELEAIMAGMDLDTSKVIDVEVTPFGAQKFLIVLVFFGTWTWKAAGGLVSRVSRSLAMSRSALPLLGLKPSIARLIRMRRGLSSLSGVVAVADRALAIKQSLSPLVGLMSAAVDAVFVNFHPSSSISLGLSLSEDETIAMARAGSPAAGLVVDIGYSHVSP